MLKYYNKEVYVPLTTDINCPECQGTSLSCLTDGEEKYRMYECKDCMYEFTIEWSE